LNKIIENLSHTPHRALCERESNLFQRGIRHFVYKHKGSPPYTFYFFIREDSNASNGYEYIYIFHVRQSARKPLTLKEAKNMKSRLDISIGEN
jgi:hypothetical protein